MRARGWIIAIDGPAGAGKTTAARNLARRLGYTYLNTGATFRAVALKLMGRAGDGDEPAAALEAAKAAKIRFGGRDNERVLLDGEDVTSLIGAPDVSRVASRISAYPEVRAVLTQLWRRMAKAGGVVLEGRDIGTVVFPDAEIKFYLVARPEIRAERRYREHPHSGQSLEQVRAAIARRDRDDSTRRHAPLARAADAIEVDTSDLDIGQTAARLEQLVRERMAKKR